MTKDNQIRTLKEEITHQEDMVAKLQKEKRSVGDSRQKTEEDIQAMEDKCNHLNKVKGKLEQALDETEDSLEREKKAKGDVEKLKRRLRETSSSLKRLSLTWKESRVNLLNAFNEKRRRVHPCLPRLRMNKPWATSTTGKSRNFNLVLRNWMRN